MVLWASLVVTTATAIDKAINRKKYEEKEQQDRIRRSQMTEEERYIEDTVKFFNRLM